MTRTSVDGRRRDKDPGGILGWVVRSYPAGRVLWVGEPADDSAGTTLAALRAEGVDARALADAIGDGQVPPIDLGESFLPGTVGDQPEGRFDLAVLGNTFEVLPLAARRGVLSAVCDHAGAVLVPPVCSGVDDELATLFAEQGFFGDFPDDKGDLPEGAVLYRNLRLPPERCPRSASPGGTLAELEGQRDDAITRYEAAVAEHDRLAERFNTLAREHNSLGVEAEHQNTEISRQAAEIHRQAAEISQQATELESLRLRRRAESNAAAAAARQVEKEFTAVARELEVQCGLAKAALAELEAVKATKVFRYSHRWRGIYGRLRSLRHSTPQPVDAPRTSSSDEDQSYETWVQAFDTMDDGRRRSISERIANLNQQPLVSILLPVYNTPEEFLRRAIESVLRQIYETWELCIVDDASSEPTVRRILEEYSARDERIRIAWRAENGHIAIASNTALALARGEWVIPLDHDDELAEHALAMAVLTAAERPAVAVVYSDEDKIDEAGRRFGPFFKPDFDPLRLLAQNYLCHMMMMRRDVVERVGGYREGTEGSQDWDLVLRLTELLQPEEIVHIPHVLYHWRAHSASMAGDLTSKPYAMRVGGRVVADHLRRRGFAAETITNAATGLVRVKWHLPETVPRVSIIIPTRDGAYLPRCIESIFRGTGYADYEVVVVDNGSVGKATLDFLRRSETWLKVVRDERAFNYSALNNAAVAHCSGEVLCLMNDDCEVMHYDWLEEMVGQLLRDKVGAVGAKLLYGDGRVQHGGIVLGVGGVAGHAHKFGDRLMTGHFSRLLVPHSLAAVTAACMVVRRSAFEQVGGLDEVNIPIAFNDVDFCLRLREAGWRVVWTPFAELMHLESVTRGPDDGHRAEGFAREIRYMQQRWGNQLREDPSYNPNLTLEHEDFSLAFPPRISWWGSTSG